MPSVQPQARAAHRRYRQVLVNLDLRRWRRPGPSVSGVTLSDACPGFRGREGEYVVASPVSTLGTTLWGTRAGEVAMEQESVGQNGVPHALRVPRALDLPGTGRHFTPEEMDRKLNVLFIVSQPTGSPAISVHGNLMRFFDRDRVDVHVVYNRLADSEPYRSAGTSVLEQLPRSPDVHLRPAEFGPVGGTPRKQLLVATLRSLGPAIRDGARLFRYVRRNRIDVIHCEKGSRNGFYAFVLSRLTRARCVMHFHWKYGSYMSPLSRLAVSRADALITVSSWTGRGIRASGVPPERIFPVLNGIDVVDWDPAAVDGASVRREFDIEPGAPLVVMIAQLVAWKRQATLIEAFRRVVEQRPSARLLLVGAEIAPPTAPGVVSYTEQLRQLVAESGLERHVTFTGRRADVRELLAAADIFALPSVDDPCALAHIEAMAMAKPIVTVEAGGAPELVEDGRTGLVGPADDSAQLAANLIDLIDDPVRARELGERGRRRVLEDLNAKRMADQVEAVYRLVSGADRTWAAGGRRRGSLPAGPVRTARAGSGRS